MRRPTSLAAALVFCAALCGGARSGVALRQDAQRTLGRPAVSGGMALNEALAKRRSCKAYSDAPVTADQISQICWAAQGVTEPAKGLRTAPAALALYAVRIYVVDGKGMHEYLPKEHALRTVHDANLLPAARSLALPQPAGGAPPVVIALCTDLSALAPRAGQRAERFALLEAGHVAQNILLQATALGLASVPVGGIDEAKTAETLKLPAGVRPVYLMPVGAPKG